MLTVLCAGNPTSTSMLVVRACTMHPPASAEPSRACLVCGRTYVLRAQFPLIFNPLGLLGHSHALAESHAVRIEAARPRSGCSWRGEGSLPNPGQEGLGGHLARARTFADGAWVTGLRSTDCSFHIGDREESWREVGDSCSSIFVWMSMADTWATPFTNARCSM